MGSEEHKDSAPMELDFSVITVSDSLSRGEREDNSGDLISEQMSDAGHNLVERVQIPDEEMYILKEISRILVDFDVDVIIMTGGTGISERDKTIETLRKIFDKEIEGFGELFRKYSYDEVGTATVLSRASAGVVDGAVIYSLPGSVNAVLTGMKIIKSEAPHMTKHLKD